MFDHHKIQFIREKEMYYSKISQNSFKKFILFAQMFIQSQVLIHLHNIIKQILIKIIILCKLRFLCHIVRALVSEKCLINIKIYLNKLKRLQIFESRLSLNQIDKVCQIKIILSVIK